MATTKPWEASAYFDLSLPADGCGNTEPSGNLIETNSAPGSPLISGLQRLAKQYPNLTVISGDILELDLAAITNGRRVRVYGNLPYYVTSPILHRLFAASDLLDEIHIVIQHEVALRLAASPGISDYGYYVLVPWNVPGAQCILFMSGDRLRR